MMHPGLMRSITSAIGSEAGIDAEYWKGGVYVYETETRSRALIEEVMLDTWRGGHPHPDPARPSGAAAATPDEAGRGAAEPRRHDPCVRHHQRRCQGAGRSCRPDGLQSGAFPHAGMVRLLRLERYDAGRPRPRGNRRSPLRRSGGAGQEDPARQDDARPRRQPLQVHAADRPGRPGVPSS